MHRLVFHNFSPTIKEIRVNINAGGSTDASITFGHMIDKENGGGNENGSLDRSITFRNTVLTPELIAAISHNSDASPTSIKSVDCIFCDLQYDGNMNTVLGFSNVQHLESLKLDMHRNLDFRRCVYVRFELSNGTLLCYRCDMMSDEERQQWHNQLVVLFLIGRSTTFINL